MQRTVIDFPRSFVTWRLQEPRSYGRFALDAVLTVEDGEKGHRDSFYLGARVLAGNVYGKGPLFRLPAYGFAPAFSATHYRLFRSAVGGQAQRDTFGAVSDVFSSVSVELSTQRAEYLEKSMICAGPSFSLVACIYLSEPAGRYRLEMQFPVRHLNFDPDAERFQVETGPVIVLAEASSSDPCAGLRRAYVNFNRLDEMHLLIDDGASGCASERWSRLLQQRCEIQVFALGERGGDDRGPAA